MLKNLFHKIANKHGYFKLSQLKIGGVCGCCGARIPDLIWVDYNDGDNWADIGVCRECQDDGDGITYQCTYGNGEHFILTKKQEEEFNAKMGKAMLETYRDNHN